MSMKFQKVKKAEMSILNLFSRKHDRNNLFTDIFLIGYFSDISRAASAEFIGWGSLSTHRTVRFPDP